MTPKIDEDFDGFILPNGEMVSIKDADRMFSFFIKRNEDQGTIKQSLWALALECVEKNYYKAAYDYFEKILLLADAPGEKADCLLRMGLAMEAVRDYKAALDVYSRGLDLPQESKEIWYFLTNNSGYCLNQIERHQEAEAYCLAAIKIEPARHNAYKNLGIALQNQGRLVEAAQNFMQATKLCPRDTRALAHLEALVACHRENPILLELLHECHELSHYAEEKIRIQ
jgi:tetratricopeptide (TPR) repeat protein